MGSLAEDRIYEEQAELCKVFSNANRLMILELLKEGEERTVTQLEEETDIPQPTISQHLSIMREKGVVVRRKEGVRSYYRISDERIASAMETMRAVLMERLEQVESS